MGKDQGTDEVTMTRAELQELVKGEVDNARREEQRKGESEEVKTLRGIIREEVSEALAALTAAPADEPKDNRPGDRKQGGGIVSALFGEREVASQ